MTPDEQATLEALLVAERQRVVATGAGLVAELRSIVEASDHANLDDEHDPEGATVGYERARVASLLEGARSRLSQLDQAADRLRTGAYGACRRCRRPIAPERLGAHPTAEACITCATAPALPLRRRRDG